MIAIRIISLLLFATNLIQGNDDNDSERKLVINGADATVNEYPWYAKLVYEEDFSCMSGNTGIYKYTGEGSDGEKEYKVVKLSELTPDDVILGYNEDLNEKDCVVKSIGQWGRGVTYGNYTSDHFIYNDEEVGNDRFGTIQMHGETWLPEREFKYEIFTTCPLGKDESGTKFTPIDSDFCGGEKDSMSWSDYLLLYRAILRIVLRVGKNVNYFSLKSYVKFTTVKQLAPEVCMTMMSCIRGEGEECTGFETVAVSFVENLERKTRKLTKKKFPGLGKVGAPGSVTACILGLD